MNIFANSVHSSDCMVPIFDDSLETVKQVIFDFFLLNIFDSCRSKQRP